MDHQPHIRIEKIHRTFGSGKSRVDALVDVNCEVHSGDFLLIKGPSGSGKTTLLNLLSGLDRPTSGRILFGGTDLSRLGDRSLSRFRNREVGYIFQAFYLEHRQTALDNVTLPLIFAGVARTERHRIGAEYLGRVGLADKVHARAGNLSAGQKQRVALARALVNNPHVVLADEPTANLDYKTGDDILALLTDINASDRRTVLLVSHERDLRIPGVRTFQMDDGRLREIGAGNGREASPRGA